VLDGSAEKLELHKKSGPQALLSPREREVMQMTSKGLTNLQIAEQLTVTVHAVKFHLASIYRKLGVSNRTEAAVAFLQAAGSEDLTH
jgi:DNA-binding NarL/FixJ family response regulator